MKVKIIAEATLDVSDNDAEALLEAKPTALVQTMLTAGNIDAGVVVGESPEEHVSWVDRLFRRRKAAEEAEEPETESESEPGSDEEPPEDPEED